MALTKRQKDVLDFLAEFVRENGYSPSYEELAEKLGLSSLATVHKHISSLEAKGYLRRGFNQSRSLEVSPEYLEEARQNSRDPHSVPLAGRIAAGALLEQVEQSDASLSFSDFVGNSSTYALEVRGESMIEDHICDGDYVLIEQAKDARNGDIVVALVNGAETTLKRFYKEPGDMARLQPSNASMEPIIVPLADVEIRGRLLAVMRKYR
jgi:repressor LexA